MPPILAPSAAKRISTLISVIAKLNEGKERPFYIICSSKEDSRTMPITSFLCEQNWLTNSIWTYTFTTLLVNQWEFLAKEFTSDVESG